MVNRLKPVPLLIRYTALAGHLTPPFKSQVRLGGLLSAITTVVLRLAYCLAILIPQLLMWDHSVRFDRDGRIKIIDGCFDLVANIGRPIHPRAVLDMKASPFAGWVFNHIVPSDDL